MVAVKPTIPAAAIAAMTYQSDRRTLAKRDVINQTTGARTELAITIRAKEAVKTGNALPMILLNGVAEPNSAMPRIRYETVLMERDFLMPKSWLRGRSTLRERRESQR
jgi:hypothetical protein